MRAVKLTLKILGWILAGIIILILAALLLIQTAFVKRQIVRIAENQVNKNLYAVLSVGKLRGDFLTHLEMDNVLLTSLDRDTIAYVPAIHLGYRLWPLLKGEIWVKKILFDQPYINLVQMSDSSWNVANIVKPSADTSTFVFNMLLRLEEVKINDGSVRIDAVDTIFPRAVKNWYVDLSGDYRTDSIHADLKDFRFVTVDPELELRQLNLKGDWTGRMLRIEDLFIQTSENQITAQGYYDFSGNKKSYVNLNTQPLVLDEFKYYLPGDFHLGARPVLHLQAELEKDFLGAEMQLADQGQGLELRLNSHHLLEYFSDDKTPVTYDLNLNIREVDLQYWLDNPDLQFIVQGMVNAGGEGLSPETMRSHITGNFNNMSVYGTRINQLDLVLDYLAGNVKGVLDGNASFGKLWIKPEINGLLSRNPQYRAQLETRDLNLAFLLGSEYPTSLNLNASLEGSGINPNTLNATGNVNLFPSHVMGYNIDTLTADIALISGEVFLDSLYAEAFGAELQASGNYILQDTADVRLKLHLDSVQPIIDLLDIGVLDSLRTRADITAHVHGIPADLRGDAFLRLHDTYYGEYHLDSLDLRTRAHVKESGKEIVAKAALKAGSIYIGDMVFDSLEIALNTDLEHVEMAVKLDSRDIQAKLTGAARLGDTVLIALTGLQAGYKGYDWHLGEDTASIFIAKDEYEIHDFTLLSPGVDTTQVLFIEGIVRRNGNQDLQVGIRNVDVAEVTGLFATGQDITGLFNLDFRLLGPASSPRIRGRFDVDNATVQQYRLDSLQGRINYRDDAFRASFSLVPQDNGHLFASARLPVTLRLSDSIQFSIPQNEDSLRLRLIIRDLPLAVMELFIKTDDVEGHIESRINVDGTMGNPRIDGNLHVVDGLVKIDRYGINYQNIQSDIYVETDNVRVDTLLIESRRGNMQAKGNAHFNQEIYKGKLDNSDLKITFDRFRPFDHRQYNMQISGEIDLTANSDSVYFSGEVTIPETEIYLPAVMRLLGRNTAVDLPKPLLIKELEGDSVTQPTITEVPVTDTVEQEKPNLEFLDNLQGDLRIIVPRNMWIKTDDMRLELSGDVELMKHRDYFELFGSVDVIRGQYNLFGKVLVIRSGTITFQGGEELNPIFNIQAQYSFRDEGQVKRDLNVNITGDINSPELSFSLGDEPVTEGDALSYLLFGKSMDGLTSGHEQSVIDAADIATNLAANVISSQLSKILGNALNVDYIELKTTGSFDNASFVVGKYITNKLFVSYEQHIGPLENKDVARYEMTLEYEIFKFLFLQLTSSSISNGADVIFKFNSKK